VRLALAWVAAVVPLAAQEAPTFRSEASLALVRFHVTQKGRYVESLGAKDVVLLEDGVPRAFSLFESGASERRTTPVDLAVLFDTSGSVMNAGLLDPLVFKSSILDGLGHVRIAIYGFDAKLRRYCPPTRDFATLRAALEALRDRTKSAGIQIPIELPPKRKSDPRGGTWIYESVIGAAKDVSSEKTAATRMLLVFSDGLSTTSSKPEDAAKLCEETGIPVYPVVLGHWKLGQDMQRESEKQAAKKNPGPPSAAAERLEEQERDVQDFASLAKLTGGHAFDPLAVDLALLRRVLTGIVGEARNEYVVGFVPESTAAARKHKLEVRLRDKSTGQIVGGTRSIVH
jgi:VWFA-related protein